MPNPCETCPITDKIAFCCSSNPETGKSKLMRFTKSRQTVYTCDKLTTDGSCEIYNERPEACKGYSCEEVYSMGLNSER